MSTTQMKMTKRLSHPVLLGTFVVLSVVAVCNSSQAESKGQEQVFAVSYESVTNKLSALKIKPAAARSQIPVPGHELVPGKTYRFFLPETEQNPKSGTYTTILVTRLDPKSTRVQIETVKLGLLFNKRQEQIEKQRLNELSQLLSAAHE